MGQCPAAEAIRDALSFYVLLSHTGNNLRNVDERTFTSCSHHGFHTVCFTNAALCAFSGMVTRCIQNFVHKLLKTFNHGTTGLRLQISTLTLAHEIVHLQLRSVYCILNIFHRLNVSNRINDSNAKTVLQDPRVDKLLNLTHESSSFLPAYIQPTRVNQTSHTRSNQFLVDCSLKELTFLNGDQVIIGIKCIRTRATIIRFTL
mmetsp:Transcript_19031/g.29402  ORF Transcript_19031/g.29402 Transcript_19031/m.29402 type:complete len:203 (-) Transcript_19031:1679-2287(-)